MSTDDEARTPVLPAEAAGAEAAGAEVAGAATTAAAVGSVAERPRRSLLRSFGPGLIVTAAFIGPGTVTTATVAGTRYGYALLWAIAFSIVATMVLQEMAARLGLVTGTGLGEAIRRRFEGPASRLIAVVLVISAIALGNAAYETGNLLGAALGAEALSGGGTRLWACLFGVASWLLLAGGSYRLVERVLIAMVVTMSVVFLATAVVLRPPLGELLHGLLVPTLPGVGGEALLITVGLIGTTVVPYNLFLHAAVVHEKWSGPEALGAARFDLILSIALGGLVTMAIVVTSAAARAGGAPVDAAAMAVQLEPLLGSWARVFFAIGLFAAGLTSAITAPLAAAYATAGAMGWPRDLRDRRLRLVWGTVLAVGVGFALSGIRPVAAILFAQVANGVLLPAIALFLLLAANDRRWMGRWANGRWMNLAAGVVVLVALVLGLRAVAGALG